MKHIAVLRSGGTVELSLPLMPVNGMWRMDSNGHLINLDHVAAIVGAPEEVER